MKLRLFNSRKFRQGSAATVITVLVIALIVVLNMVVTMLADRLPMSADLTANKVFSLSDETKEFLSTLDKDVEIYVLNSEENFTSAGRYNSEYYIQANEMLKRYERQNGRIRINYVELSKNPMFEENYESQLIVDHVLIVCGDKELTVSSSDLFNTQQSFTNAGQLVSQVTSSKAEQTITSAILSVTSENRIRVALLTGHNEQPMDALVSLLALNNYEIEVQNLVTEEIDEEADIAILAAPDRDLTEDELRKLDRFLDNGGRRGKTLLYFASYRVSGLTNLEAFLSDWGIGVGDGVVFDAARNRVLSTYHHILVDYGESEYAATAISKSLPAATQNAKPLEQVFETKSSRTTTVLMRSSAESSGLRGSDTLEMEWTPSEQELVAGGMPVMILCEDLTYDGTTPQRSYVVASGSYLSAEAGALNVNYLGNSEFYLDMLGSLAGREEVIRIQDKTLSNNQLGIQTMGQVLIIGIVLVVLLPLVVLVSGIVIWIRRRHR